MRLQEAVFEFFKNHHKILNKLYVYAYISQCRIMWLKPVSPLNERVQTKWKVELDFISTAAILRDFESSTIFDYNNPDFPNNLLNVL